MADLLVEDAVLVELKAARTLDSSHEAQCINSLAATRLPTCLLLNFGAKVQVRRFAGPDAQGGAVHERAGPPEGMTWAEAAEFEGESIS